MVELSLNNEALKRDHFTDWKNIQCKTNKQIITLVAQYRDDISPSRLYCHSSAAHENTSMCS